MTPRRWTPPRLAHGPRCVLVSEGMADALDGLCRGWTAARLGAWLGISENTAKTHLKRLYVRLGAHDRAHAVALVLTGTVQPYVREREQR